MVRQVDLAAAVECPRAARISNLVSFYKPTFFASAGRAAARASPFASARGRHPAGFHIFSFRESDIKIWPDPLESAGC